MQNTYWITVCSKTTLLVWTSNHSSLFLLIFIEVCGLPTQPSFCAVFLIGTDKEQSKLYSDWQVKQSPSLYCCTCISKISACTLRSPAINKNGSAILTDTHRLYLCVFIAIYLLLHLLFFKNTIFKLLMSLECTVRVWYKN